MTTNEPPSRKGKGAINVLHLVFSLASGGAENGIVNLTNHLAPEEFSTTILCLDERGAFAERLSPKVPVVCLERNYRFSWEVTRRLADVLRGKAKERTVLHTHNHGPLLYGALAKLRSRSAVPILHGEHAELFGQDLNLRRRIQRAIFYRLSARIHTVCQATKSQLVELGYDATKITAVLNGVDCDRFKPATDRSAAKASHGLPAGATVIGYVARFAPSKRHSLLLETFAQLGELYPDLHILLVGDGGASKQDILEQIRSHPFSSRIHWKGFQASPEALYQAMDLFVLPSEHEGLANAMLEAMATGIPVLANRSCGANEVLEHPQNGHLAEMHSPADLKTAIVEMLSQPTQLARISQQARQTAKERFSLTAMANGYSDLYRSLFPSG